MGAKPWEMLKADASEIMPSLVIWLADQQGKAKRQRLEEVRANLRSKGASSGRAPSPGAFRARRGRRMSRHG